MEGDKGIEMKVVITDEDVIKKEEQTTLAMKELLQKGSLHPVSSDWVMEQAERLIRRMASNITNSQPWRRT